MARIRVAIVAVTGYAGVETARLLFRHPEVTVTAVTGNTLAGQKLADIFPHLAAYNMPITSEVTGSVDVVIAALPHKKSAEVLTPLVKQGLKVIDLSADFRLKDPKLYEMWYGFTHPSPDTLKEAVFGLPELYRAQIKAAKLIANPGCYPTGAILGLAPLIKEGLVGPDIIIDSKSGVSGAGREPGMGVHFSEINEDVAAYALPGHRHLPEITQELTNLNQGPALKITFVPHLIPMVRGIFTTAYVTPLPGKIGTGREAKQKLLELYQAFYQGEPFVRVAAVPPHTKHTTASNFCVICPTIDDRTGRLIILSVLDNLVKGAAGQAVQNMNLMCGIPETTGLEQVAVYP